MTKREANAAMRKRYPTGAAWHERPGGKAERDALMRGVKKVLPKKKAAPGPAFRVKAGGVIQAEGRLLQGGYGLKERPFVVVEIEPGRNRAFYMSTGTGGTTDIGEWNLFGGIGAEGHMGRGWFIKPQEGKRVKGCQEVAAWLTKTVGSTSQEASRFVQSRG